MPLALVRFALQSFPLENSIVLSSNTITQLEWYEKNVTHPKTSAAYYILSLRSINPLSSPFTSCFGFTLCKWPILSWVRNAF